MPKLIVALDVATADAALTLVDRLGEDVEFYKVGSPLHTRVGPGVVRELRARGKRVFLDLKFHDIPNTVAGAVSAAAELGVELLTVHASGGEAMLRAAVQAAGEDGPSLLAVTVLTSLGAAGLEQAWGRPVVSLPDEVERLAALAVSVGVPGVVASPLEVAALRRRFGERLLIVAPGIRPAGHAAGDQVRTASPLEAARAGADFLVIGRPVLESSDPRQLVRAVQAELESAVEVS